MEYKRLTTKDESGDIILNCQECQYHELFCMICTDYHCINALKTRLAELEDKIEQGVLASIEDMLKNGELVSKEWHDEQVMHAENELQEYQNRIENGTLIDLPCKVGDWLYYIYENKIHKAKVEEIKFNVYKHGIKNESIDIFAYDFKNKLELSFYYKEDFSKLDTETIDFVKTFLTKAEAEKKLKELKGVKG